jgi:M6 family metalloprotease-like protein
MKKAYITLFFAVITGFFLRAAYIEKMPITLIQPNGDTLHCYATGDDYYQWLHDEKNYTIILDNHTGYYVYANLADGLLIPTSLIPGIDHPEMTLIPGLNITPEKMLALRKFMEDQVPERVMTTRGPNKGKMNNIVIFIRFSDDSEFTTLFSDVDQKFNDSSTVEAVSVYNYVKNVSYQQMYVLTHFYPVPNGSQILSYQDIFPRDYYLPYSEVNQNGYQNSDTANQRTQREHALLIRAVEYVQNIISDNIDFDYDDDGNIDNISFVVKGEVGDWADLLWPHRWSLFSDSVTINDLRVWDYNFLLANTGYFNTSTMSHELLHTFGYPDLYRYSYEGTPVGQWDIMSGNTNPPQQANIYCKWKYGHWIDEIPEITEAGFYTLFSNQGHKERSAFKIASSNPDEFFVLEFRRKVLPFDGEIPNSGVVIYRINTLFDGNAGTNMEDVFDEVYIFRYNGSIDNDGSISAASFYLDNPLLYQFNPWTNPYPFLTDGTVCFFELNQFTTKIADSISFYYSPEPISVSEYAVFNSNVAIYPNPALDQLSVNFTSTISSPISYTIFDATGKEAQSGFFSETLNTIDISLLVSGIYFIQMKTPQENKGYKFLKN